MGKKFEQAFSTIHFVLVIFNEFNVSAYFVSFAQNNDDSALYLSHYEAG
jgi:hypothetical protein